MKVKHVLLAAVAAAVLGLTSIASASTYSGMGFDTYAGVAGANRLPGYYSGSGGEFTIYDLPGGGPNNTLFGLNQLGYQTSGNVTAGLYGDATSIQTFCVEHAEYIGIISTDNKVVISNTNAVGGTPASSSRTTNINLAPQTAFLYEYFAVGGLPNYNYTAGAGRAADAATLQNAIWGFQGQIPLDTTNKFVIMATQATNPLDASGKPWSQVWVGKGIDKVRIINLWTDVAVSGTTPTDVSGPRQDQLWLSGVPDIPPIPLPATVWSAGALLAMVVFSRVRRLNAQA